MNVKLTLESVRKSEIKLGYLFFDNNTQRFQIITLLNWINWWYITRRRMVSVFALVMNKTLFLIRFSDRSIDNKIQT